MVYPDSEVFVVWGQIGLDEVSPTGKTTVWHAIPQNPEISTFEIDPATFGLKEHALADCASLGPHENAQILKTILNGTYHKGENGIYDYILLNTAVLYCLSTGNKNWKRGVQAAEESIHSGRALKSLEHFVKATQAL